MGAKFRTTYNIDEIKKIMYDKVDLVYMIQTQYILESNILYL